MKKNRTMKVAALLLALTLMTSCFVGGTFAKYTSSQNVTATATVAKWDVTIEGTQIAVTGEAPTISLDLAETWTDYDGTAEKHVTEKLLAPGTKGSFNFVITNNSEVEAEYSITLSENIANLPAGFDEANFPVEYSLVGTAEATDWTKDITGLTIDGDLTFAEKENTITVYWRWAFGATSSENAIDTALGIQGQTAAPEVTVTATIVVSQVN